MRSESIVKQKNFWFYITGFGLSVFLTLIAFLTAQKHVDSGHLFISHSYIIIVLFGLALIQLLVQLIFFLHVWREDKPRWNLLFFVGTFTFIIFIVIASVIIMNNLDYRMHPEKMSDYLIEDEGINVDNPEYADDDPEN